MIVRNGNEVRKALFSTNGIYAQNDIILLRMVQAADKENYLNIYRSKPIWQNMFADPELNVAEELWKSFTDLDTLNTIIIRKSDGAFCGFCGLQNFTKQSAPELSIELIKECQNQGIGTLALPMLMQHFSEITGTKEYISKVSCENAVSLHLMRKLGGIPHGIAPYPGITESIMKIMEESNEPLPDGIESLAQEFGSIPRKLRSHVLVFRFSIDND